MRWNWFWIFSNFEEFSGDSPTNKGEQYSKTENVFPVVTTESHALKYISMKHFLTHLLKCKSEFRKLMWTIKKHNKEVCNSAAIT